MLARRKILIVSENYEQAIPLECPLRLAGYEVDYRQDLGEAISLCELTYKVSQKFDLLIADVGFDDHAQLIELQQRGFIDRLMFVQQPSECSELYCIHGPFACLGSSSATLAAVKELFELSNLAQSECRHKCRINEKLMECIKKFENVTATRNKEEIE